MKKPKNRKERIELIEQKEGNDFAKMFYTRSDGEVKKYLEQNYHYLKNKDDFIYEIPTATCLRCGEEVLHHYECTCGYDRVIFDDDMWKEDIESYSDEIDRCDGDEEFIANGYSSKHLTR